MNYKVTNMCDEYAKQIAQWQYDGEYAEYNTLSYEQMKEKGSGIVNPAKRDNYLCFVDDNDKLIAYMNIMKRDNNTVFLGIGTEPNSCGKGLGKIILQKGLDEAKKRYKDSLITLQVRSWNKRAIKCYENVGFKTTKIETIKDHNGVDAEFVFMEYALN